MLPWVILGVVLVIGALALWIPRMRLKKAINAPFPEEWAALLEQNIQVYKKLPMPLRLQLRKLIKHFLHHHPQMEFTNASQHCLIE